MRFAIAALLTLAACAAPDTTAPTVTTRAPMFGIYDATRPAPVLTSAVAIATDTLEVTFTETATDAALVSAYASGNVAAATANIDPAGALVERTVRIVLAGGHSMLQLRYLWSTDLSDPAANIWGPFSNAVAITEAAPIAATTTKKGHKK